MGMCGCSIILLGLFFFFKLGKCLLRLGKLAAVYDPVSCSKMGKKAFRNEFFLTCAGSPRWVALGT